MTQRVEPKAVRSVGIVGAGMIGSGWACHFLRMGMDVVAFDPAPGAEERLRDFVAAAWPVLETLGLRDGASPERLRVVDQLAGLSGAVVVVQENIAEDLEAKSDLFRALDEVLAPETIVLSSTSWLSMTKMQDGCAGARRLVTGHPLNPPYLLRCIEVAGGRQTDPAAVRWAMDFYRAMELLPIHLKREVPGLVANRLQEALTRAALQMVAMREATLDDIDTVLMEGLAPRWSTVGFALNLQLSAGAKGIDGMLDLFGAQVPDGPRMPASVRGQIVNACAKTVVGRTPGELAEARDRALLRVKGYSR